MVLLAQVGQPRDLGRQPDRGNRDMPGTEAQTTLVAGHVERLDQVIEVGQRLAHAHDDDVGQPLVGGQQVPQAKELFEDFRRRSGCGPRR